MKFDRAKFYGNLRAWRGSLSQQQVNGLNFLLDAAERDPYLTRLEWLAYMLATTAHETAWTFQPIHEYGSKNYFIRRYGGQTRKGKELGNDTPEEGFDYAGKGFPQTTGESNYEKAEAALRREYPALVADFERRTGRRFDLTVGDQPNDKRDPQNMLDPQIAYAVMSFGMRTGMFTTKKLSDYINDFRKDYKGARKIINGTDKDELIAGYAVRFERILRASFVNDFDDLNDDEIKLEIPPKEDFKSYGNLKTSNPTEFESSSGAFSVKEQVGQNQKDLPETSLETPSEANAPAEQNQAVETSKTISEETPEKKVETEIATVNEQSVKEVEPVPNPEPYNGKGFWATIKTDLAAVFGGNATVQTAAEYAHQAQATVPASLLTKLAYVVAAVSIGYLLFRVIHFGFDSWKKNQRTKLLAEINTDITRKNMEFKG